MITYEPLRNFLKENNISWYRFQKDMDFPNTTIERLKKDSPTEITTIDYICDKYDLSIECVVKHIPTNDPND